MSSTRRKGKDREIRFLNGDRDYKILPVTANTSLSHILNTLYDNWTEYFQGDKPISVDHLALIYNGGFVTSSMNLYDLGSNNNHISMHVIKKETLKSPPKQDEGIKTRSKHGCCVLL
ncbi:hypothetical protein SNEBB_006440 [Seison nebaliae]|nr:hypothetical protein SNEBB_006440 [Seison nebaliae]